MEIEEWRKLPEHPAYEVSNLGRVRSWKRRSCDPLRGPSRPRIITPKNLNAHGHKFFEAWDSGKRFKYPIHPTVLRLFVRPKREGEQALHRNGVPDDNRVENLYWGTHQQNMDDMVAHGNSERGETNSKAVLTERDVFLINRMSEFMKESDIATVFGISKGGINAALSGRTWRYDA